MHIIYLIHYTRYRILSGAEVLRFDEVISLWQDDTDFRLFFFEILSASSYSAYRFETPVISSRNCSKKFEFVLIDTPWLDLKQDQSAFAEHFNKTYARVVEFDNLGADATLVVPCPLSDETAYAHMAAFMRRAPEIQIHQLWEKVGQCLMDKIRNQNIWLNTAGGSVDWLHVRLDSTPKYYAYHPYKYN